LIRVGIAQHQARNAGGIATYARGLVEGLGIAAARDLRVEPVAATRRPQNALTRLAWEQLRVPAAARAVDILHMTDFRIPLRCSTPVVATVHDVGFITHPGYFEPVRRRYKHASFNAMVARKPDLIACDSAYTLARLGEVAPSIASRCALLPPGVASPRGSFVRSPEPDILLSVGLSGRRKNLTTLVHAYRRARASGLNLTWVVVGNAGRADEPLLHALRQTDGVVLAGSISQLELERYWARAAFIAVPSVLEGFSYPVLEAMQRRVPVIASRGSAFDETASDAAYRVDATDADGWADALLRLSVSEAERTRLAEAGVAHAADYTWERRAPAFVEAYGGLVR
jgi:glycosyltransferase involved in cell wall biosynthesis